MGVGVAVGVGVVTGFGVGMGVAVGGCVGVDRTPTSTTSTVDGAELHAVRASARSSRARSAGVCKGRGLRSVEWW